MYQDYGNRTYNIINKPFSFCNKDSFLSLDVYAFPHISHKFPVYGVHIFVSTIPICVLPWSEKWIRRFSRKQILLKNPGFRGVPLTINIST